MNAYTTHYPGELAHLIVSVGTGIKLVACRVKAVRVGESNGYTTCVVEITDTLGRKGESHGTRIRAEAKNVVPRVHVKRDKNYNLAIADRAWKWEPKP